MNENHLNEKSRPAQIHQQYVQLIQEHLTNLVSGKVDKMFEIEDFAQALCIHPTHLTNTMKELTGMSACGIFQTEIGHLAKALLGNPEYKIQDVALILDFEPTQFTKWFRRIFEITPKEFRTAQLKNLNQDHFPNS
ncbi:helix-turn-helix transcriptional regulator [Dyadobacter luticola]|uniref:Helix-turn-helix transcriptional regulator n=1 Tax=Dyadobacter luticola TaxID=1979387 RepID=A0A5R9L603_9BACT|nr:AraC family transcriptional regulator [Dyadobacter luticola]TLV03993.1 helix-turn-helix transcriptional regulator [Dyadobacter luticola]